MLDPAGAGRGGEHLLVVGVVCELEHQLAAAVGHDGDPGITAAQPAGASGTITSSCGGLLGAQVLDGAAGDHPAGVDDPDRVAEPLDQVELMAGEHDRHARAGALQQDAGQGVHADRIQPGERLVQDEHLGVVHQRGGELDPLLVAEGQLLDRVVAALGDAEPLGQLVGDRARPRRPGRAAGPGRPGAR